MRKPAVITCIVAAVGAPALAASAQTFSSSAGPIAVETVAGGLVHPWALAFLPDGRMLVTERPGRMRIVTRDGKLSPPLAGVPYVQTGGQAGLLDVILDRGFARNHTVYFCFNANAAGAVALARARLLVDEMPRLADMRVLFTQMGPPSPGLLNVACRIAQGADGNLFLTLGDHFKPRDEAQNLANDIGKVMRLAPDGSVPRGNPFIGKSGARPEIWSYGHRNAEGLAFDPRTGKLWEQEHGPRGGDEINIIEPGRNYGWPVIGYGIDYNGARIHESTHKAGMEQPVWHWTPSIAPSGMAFYTGDLFPAWKGSLFNGALKFQMLVRLELDGDRVVKEERLLHELGERIRDVRQGPDGALWLLTDNSDGRILRVVPAK